MKLSNLVTVRLGHDFYVRYSTAAAAAGIPLATYLRNRLESEETVETHLRAIRQDLAFAPQGRPGSPAASDDRAIRLETLLLLRTIAGPDRSKAAQSELERQGLTLWTGEEGSHAPG